MSDRESAWKIHDKISEAIGLLNGAGRALLEKDIVVAQDQNYEALRVCKEIEDLFWEKIEKDGPRT